MGKEGIRRSDASDLEEKAEEEPSNSTALETFRGYIVPTIGGASGYTAFETALGFGIGLTVTPLVIATIYGENTANLSQYEKTGYLATMAIGAATTISAITGYLFN